MRDLDVQKVDVQDVDIQQADVIVVGGGLAGLVAAATVTQAGYRAEVIDRSREPGGNARSTTREGFVLNQGPHALYKGGRGAAILRALGITMTGGSPSGAGSVVFADEAQVLPSGPISLLKSGAMGSGEKAKFGLALTKLGRLKPAEFGSVSVADWVDGQGLGPRAQELLHALVRLTTYVHAPEQLSAQTAIEQLQLGSTSGVRYLDGGWQSLVDQLSQGINFRSETVTEVPDARAVVLAAGGPAVASKILNRAFEVGQPAEVSCLDLGVTRRPDEDFVLGGDVPLYLSHHSAQAALAPDGHFLLSIAQYLGHNAEPDADGLLAFARHGGIEQDDVVMSRRLHRMTACSAIPLAAHGGVAGRPTVTDTGSDNVFVAGDWVGAEGHLADAAIASGHRAGLAAVGQLSR